MWLHKMNTMFYFIEIGIANELTLLKNNNTELCTDSGGTLFSKDQNYWKSKAVTLERGETTFSLIVS